jgi:phosphoglycerate dehydrogenase-like enzyme
VGFGGIGQAFAKMVTDLGAKVLAWDVAMDTEALEKIGGEWVRDLDYILARSDIVSFHLPGNDQTSGMITYQHLNLIKPGSIILNTGRAEVFAHRALYLRLADGDIQGGFDVWENEPLAADDPLRTLDNVVHTPHNAFRTRETGYKMVELGLENVKSFISGKVSNIV